MKSAKFKDGRNTSTLQWNLGDMSDANSLILECGATIQLLACFFVYSRIVQLPYKFTSGHRKYKATDIRTKWKYFDRDSKISFGLQVSEWVSQTHEKTFKYFG